MDIKNELVEPVKDILKSIEELTKKPFRFVEKSDLETYAGVRIARSNMPEHIIVYKTEHNDLINHLIAHECGHIKRIYETPPEKRLMVISTDDHKHKGMSIFEKDLQALSKSQGLEIASKLANMWYSGLVRQVTNQPVDLMIEKWLYEDYPALRGLQITSLSDQNDLALQGLNKRVKEITPRFVFHAGNLMNVAYTISLSKIIRVKLVRQWKPTEFYAEALDLAKMLDIEKGWQPENDCDMVNLWAKRMKLNDWFTWHPFEDVPLSYYRT
jgi:hypothetical protein